MPERMWFINSRDKEVKTQLRGDQIEVFKILNGYENIEICFSHSRKIAELEDLG